MLRSLASLAQRFAAACGFWVQYTGRRGNPYVNLPSWAYQEPIVSPHLRSGDIVLDIGSGNNPIPRADVLADFFPDDSFHRSGAIVDDRPLVVCSLDRMPFRDSALGFVLCSHVLEHVQSPQLAAAELSRVARAGYVETPAYGKDILIGTGYMHRWQIVEFEGVMHFFEYSPRQTEANVTSPVMKIWMSPYPHPWQQFFWERQDLFNACVLWTGTLKVLEYRRKGSAPALPAWKQPREDMLRPDPPSLTADEVSLLERCLATPDGKQPMHFDGMSFRNADGSVVYPVHKKRIYCELGVITRPPRGE